MGSFVVFNIAINVNNEWFLPFQQARLLGTINAPLVQHTTRSGFKIAASSVLHEHYIVERNNIEYHIPIEAATITSEEIPQEWVNRHILEQKYRSDNIRDYILAAKKYLNIEIKAGPDVAWWRKLRQRKPDIQVGKHLNKDEIQKE